MTFGGFPEGRTSKKLSDSHAQPVTAARWWVLVAIGIGTFMSALDGSVVNTILPVLRRSFSSSIAEIEWVVIIYLLVLSGLLLSFGRLGDIQGHKRVYLSGFAVFTISSLFCATSNSVNMLVLFRGVQALGAAMLQANSPAILTKSFPANQRGQALGLQATMTYLGLTTGPTLGGWLAETISWRAVFFINLPIGITAFLLSYRFILPDHDRSHDEKFDLAGAFLFLTGLASLLYGLNQGHALGWFTFPIIGSIGFAGILLGSFWYLEKHHQQPMLDTTLFRNARFRTSVISAILNYICVYSITFLMPFYLIQGLNLPASQTGVLLTSMSLTMAIVAPISGSLSDRFGTRPLAAFGMGTLTIGLFLLSQLEASTSIQQIALRLSLAGLGIGTFISPNNSALMGSAPGTRQGIAAGVMATSRNFGMVLGIGFAGAVFTSFLNENATAISANLYHAINASFIMAAVIAAAGTVLVLANTG